MDKRVREGDCVTEVCKALLGFSDRKFYRTNHARGVRRRIIVDSQFHTNIPQNRFVRQYLPRVHRSTELHISVDSTNIHVGI